MGRGLTNKTLELFNKIGIDNPKIDKLYGAIPGNNARKTIVILGQTMLEFYMQKNAT